MKGSFLKLMNLYGLIISAMLLLTGCTSLQHGSVAETAVEETPPEWLFHTIVGTEFVNNHISVPMPENVMIIDARPYKPKYIKGHIPGAVNIPDSQFDKHTDLLPKDKEILLIYYCGGLKCKLSHKSARKAEALGYNNVKVYALGFPEWAKTPGNYVSVNVEYVARAIEENKALIVDARPRQTKFNKGHIPSAINIPFSQFDKLKGKLPMDTATPIIFYCGGLTCRLSHKAATAALVMGYTDVKVLSRGYPEWKKVYGEGSALQQIQVKAGEIEGSMDIESFKEILTTRPESIMIVDVRDKDEFDKGTFKTAVNIPVDKLEDKIKTLPGNKPLIFICSTGARSGEAYYMVQDLRASLKDVFYLEAACTFKKDGSFEIKKTEE